MGAVTADQARWCSGLPSAGLSRGRALAIHAANLGRGLSTSSLAPAPHRFLRRTTPPPALPLTGYRPPSPPREGARADGASASRQRDARAARTVRSSSCPADSLTADHDPCRGAPGVNPHSCGPAVSSWFSCTPLRIRQPRASAQTAGATSLPTTTPTTRVPESRAPESVMGKSNGWLLGHPPLLHFVCWHTLSSLPAVAQSFIMRRSS